ncbi:MAG: hypothetical protein KGK10_02560 [Rhodospirillales bacterium]|nr:hypothetical protein [Rhodospirillales bacterium]
MLVCRDVSEMLTDLTERKLGPRQWLGVRWHLRICPMCRAFLAQLRATSGVLAGLELPADPPAEERALAQRPTAEDSPGERPPG